jgi:hypothetical protein
MERIKTQKTKQLFDLMPDHPEQILPSMKQRKPGMSLTKRASHKTL